MISTLQKNLKHDNNTVLPCLLPSMHSTSCFNAEEIYKENKIKVQLCDKFKKKLVYFFYGKPVYKVAQNETQSRSDNLLSPVCFIVDTKKIPIKLIIPFDSGAYISKKYDNIFPDDFISKEKLVKNFSLNNNINTIKIFIKNFYGNNENYLSGICCFNDNLACECSMESLINLLKSKGNFNFDDRAKTVEIICKKDIKLNKIVKAIIIPKNHINNKYFQDFKKKNPHVEVIAYKTHYPLCPVLLNEAVFQKAYDYITKENLI